MFLSNGFTLFLRKKREKMKTSDFYYDLPEELIAQTPVEPRDRSRLLVFNKDTGDLLHKHFYIQSIAYQIHGGL